MNESILNKLAATLMPQTSATADTTADEGAEENLDAYLDMIAAGRMHSSHHQDNHSSS